VIKELRGIINNLKPRNLVNNPDKNIKRQKVYRAKALIKSFDPREGKKLNKIIKDFLEVARAGIRKQHINHLAHDIKNFIIEKTEEIETYNFKNDKKKNKKSNDSDKFFNKLKKNPLISLLITTVVVLAGVIGFYNDFFDFKDKFFSSKNEEHAILPEPSLNFLNDEYYPYIDFKYFDLNYNKIENKNITDTVNLKELTRIQFDVNLENDGNIDLIKSLKKIVVKLSNGKYLTNSPPDINKENTFLSKGMKFSISMGGITSEYLLSELEKDEFFHIIFQPEIEYYTEKKKEKIYFNKIIICSNTYVKSKLPLFKPRCSISQIKL